MNKNKHKIITFAALMTVATIVIHFINRTIAAAAQLKQLLGITHSKYFEWRFGNIYYTKKGDGKPILLIHDTLPGASGYEWSEIEEKLAEDHTVYTVDLLGCGRSDKPGITYTNFVYVQMICDFIRKIIGQKTDIIASGFSSSFVIMACHNEKELFNKIMLVNPPSPDFLRQMPTRRDHLLKLALEIPVFGTCAGMVLLGKKTDFDQPLLGIMDISVKRNAFGRQVDSFGSPISILGEDYLGVFIRAPSLDDYDKTKEDIKVLSELDDEIVAIQQGHNIAIAFHPELTDDTRIHEYFIKEVLNCAE